ncbi:hypothetical protein Fot_11010 [Forsythia ovata]|uniref:Uncharacterized protein n=1 Tax=Forsythia ovata TaxID=205694 RepID=A0ABD1WIG1_9LAMI
MAITKVNQLMSYTRSSRSITLYPKISTYFTTSAYLKEVESSQLNPLYKIEDLGNHREEDFFSTFCFLISTKKHKFINWLHMWERFSFPNKKKNPKSWQVEQDEGRGKIIKKLRQKKQQKNTIIIVLHYPTIHSFARSDDHYHEYAAVSDSPTTTIKFLPAVEAGRNSTSG